MKIIDVLRRHLPMKYIKAIQNNMIEPNEIFMESMSLEVDFLTLFDWEDSREGYEFWESVLEAMLLGSDLPDFPIAIDYAPNTYIIANDKIQLLNMGGSGLDIEFDIDKKLVKQANPRALEKYLSFLN
jgi:hypothetical protein